MVFLVLLDGSVGIFRGDSFFLDWKRVELGFWGFLESVNRVV